MCSNKAEIQQEMFQKCFKHSSWHEIKFPQFLSLLVMNLLQVPGLTEHKS